MNYFNYFTEIEDAFIRRRGKHLLLSPMDWALIESWKQMEVPLHVALRGIEKSFDSWEAKPRKRTVKSLLYCQEEVEAQFAEWMESRVGAEADSGEPAEDSPFSRSAITEHLERGIAALSSILKTRSRQTRDDFWNVLERAVRLLEDLKNDFVVNNLPAQKLEQSLAGIERMVSDALRLALEPEVLSSAENEVKEQLKPYRKNMAPTVYQQTFDNLLLKRLREQFDIPRLSLFYI